MKKITKRKKLIILTISLAGILLIAGYILNQADNTEPTQDSLPEPIYSKLTGLEVSAEEADLPILGVMIENSLDARPQSGLDSAGIVFEALTEGGITRYLALYQEDQPELVGPIRSIRTHFLNWSMGFDSPLGHVGGSAPALEAAKQRKSKSLSEFSYPDVYFRDDSRDAPHNVYAKSADLRDLVDKLGYSESQFPEIPRSEDNPTQAETAQAANIEYSGPNYHVRFDYSADGNNYKRFLAGEPHIDALTNQQISVKNVVVIKALTSGDDVESIGKGTAWVFKNGNVTEASWEKPSFDERIRIIDENGDEVPLNRGQTWFCVIRNSSSVAY